MISVVVPIYLRNKEAYAMTDKCLSMAKKLSSTEIKWIIVETGSDFFKDYADIHIYEKERTTCTKSINRGFKLADGQYIVLLTNDVFLEQDWDRHLLTPFTKAPSCGMTTLATTQLRHKKENVITEGIWCSVFMIPRWLLEELGYFDENFVNSWDDTDLVMRVYLKNLKMYRNYNAVVEHLVGATEYGDENHNKNYIDNRNYFMKKHEKHKNHRMYKVLTEGWVL